MKARESVKLTFVALAAIPATFVVFFGALFLLAELRGGGPVPLPEVEGVEELQSALYLG